MLDTRRPKVAPVLTAIGVRHPELLRSIAHTLKTFELRHKAYPPFLESTGDAGPSLLPPRPRHATRSVLFLHNSYYHFYYLARALRARGWDAVLATSHDPAGDAAPYFHGEDVNIFSPDPDELSRRSYALYREVAQRFRMVHFAGMHLMSLFRENFDRVGWVGAIPWDFLALKSKGVKIGYSISGCHDGMSQSGFFSHTGVCSKCIWQLRPDVCSDSVNVAWGRKLERVCDLISVEGDWALEGRRGPQAFREPLTMCLDHTVWHPDITVPDHLRVGRSEGELVVMHAFGNSETRIGHGRDIKGHGAIRRAVDRLIDEGHRIRFISPSGVPSSDMRHLQVQADIVVDQLNYGRYGAQARESMMLGKPTVCYIDRRQGPGLPPLRSLEECPLVSATEDTVYEVLKRLVFDADERRRVGHASRRYAMKWHSADACAERFERVYDRLQRGLPPQADEVFELSSKQSCAA